MAGTGDGTHSHPAKRRVVVAMSGGVDSSVAAALLAEAGFDVVGVSMRLWQPAGGAPAGGCCTLDDFLDARRVAEMLDIPFYVMDFRETFRRTVVEDFVSEYRRGRTPNPCVRCNQFVKFASFLDRARELGAESIATGHYARRRNGAAGPELWCGVDRTKDQSYFLFPMGAEVLSRTLFPVGEYSKTEVRAEARRRGLPVAGKPDSQEVCFAPRGDYAAFVERYPSAAPLRPGKILDPGGNVLGAHRGVHRFTVGQRRGLGIGTGGPPRYVTEVDGDRGVVRVGDRAQVMSGGLVAVNASWIGRPPREGQELAVKIRSRFAPQPALVAAVAPDAFTVHAPDGLRAVTPGQAAVLYDGERVIGGGWIQRAVRQVEGRPTRRAV